MLGLGGNLIRGYRERVALLEGCVCSMHVYMGGFQNYGPFLGPQYSTAPSI